MFYCEAVRAMQTGATIQQVDDPTNKGVVTSFSDDGTLVYYKPWPKHGQPVPFMARVGVPTNNIELEARG